MNKLFYTLCALATTASFAFAQTGGDVNKSSPQQGMTGQANQGAKTGGTQPTQAQGGIQSVNPAGGVKMTFYTVQPADMRASKLIGANVYNLQNENIGEIEDLMIDNGKNVRAVVIGVGGFLGMGEHDVAVQPNSVTVTEQSDGSIKVVLNTNKEELKNAPGVKAQDLDKSAAAGSSNQMGSSNTTTGTGATQK